MTSLDYLSGSDYFQGTRRKVRVPGKAKPGISTKIKAR